MRMRNFQVLLAVLAMPHFAACEMHAVEDSTVTTELSAQLQPEENAKGDHLTAAQATDNASDQALPVPTARPAPPAGASGAEPVLEDETVAPAPVKLRARKAKGHLRSARSLRAPRKESAVFSGRGYGGGAIGHPHGSLGQLDGSRHSVRFGSAAPNTEAYEALESNAWRRVTDAPLSTFSIDVDTAAYANVRRMLREGRLPVHGAVRIEEMLNYFNYPDETPTDGTPFAVHTEVGDTPWNTEHRLVRVGIKGREIPRGERPASNLVFLLDVSGSMRAPDKLPLLKEAFKLLAGQLDGRDTVTIAVYAGSSGLALPPTRGDQRSEILNAIDRLRSGGSTHGAAGIKLAYKMATKHFIKDGINRVILATDGDMNVGTSSKSELVDLVKHHAQSGVFLSVLGFGRGNLKDATMEAIANKGNGNYAYIDSVREARKVLSDQFGGTLITIAKDVKLQVEFNPAHVAGYRLIGYENRKLAARDFNDDKKDAGELGAGHTVTALYELVPAGQTVPESTVDALKYQKPMAQARAADSRDLLTVKLRYKLPSGSKSKLVSHVVQLPTPGSVPSMSFRWASAVAAFGMLLRDSPYRGSTTWESVIDLATSAIGNDASGQRMEMVVLAKEARRLAAASAQAKP